VPVARSFPPTALESPAPLVSHGSRAYPVIAITIDDCFSPAAVQANLEILGRERVNATWFPVGRSVAAAPATWRAVAAAGFPIANHTYDHGNLTRYDYARIVADIERADAVVSAIIGRPLLPFVRPLGGAWNGTVLSAAAAAGERAVVLWDTTTGDSAALPWRTSVDLLVRNATRGTNGSIILMHANQPYTQQALPRIIASYRARGFEFVTLGQMFGVDGPVPFPPGTRLPRPSAGPGISARPSPAPPPGRHPS
jgi:peptidoglycan/xylan/chitin deacetylase (PgdA/CDA1 family)